MTRTPALDPISCKALVFDFDGVILESADIKTEAFCELFRDQPEHREAIRDYHLSRLGISRFEKFDWIYRELLKRRLSPVEREQLGAEFSRIVLAKVLRCPFVPGALEALRELHKQLPLFVASGTPQAELDLILRERQLDHFFIEALGSPRTKPEILRSVLGTLQIDPAKLLFVGDGLSDYEAAVATGVGFVARGRTELRGTWKDLNVAVVADLWPFMRLRTLGADRMDGHSCL